MQFGVFVVEHTVVIISWNVIYVGAVRLGELGDWNGESACAQAGKYVVNRGQKERTIPDSISIAITMFELCVQVITGPVYLPTDNGIEYRMIWISEQLGLEDKSSASMIVATLDCS